MNFNLTMEKHLFADMRTFGGTKSAYWPTTAFYLMKALLKGRISFSYVIETLHLYFSFKTLQGLWWEKNTSGQGITKDGAKFSMAQVGCSVPKITLMCNGSFGAGNYAMCGRAFDSRFIFSWQNHQIGIMGGEQAAKTFSRGKRKTAKKGK